MTYESARSFDVDNEVAKIRADIEAAAARGPDAILMCVKRGIIVLNRRMVINIARAIRSNVLLKREVIRAGAEKLEGKKLTRLPFDEGFWLVGGFPQTLNFTDNFGLMSVHVFCLDKPISFFFTYSAYVTFPRCIAAINCYCFESFLILPSPPIFPLYPPFLDRNSNLTDTAI